MVRLVSPKLNVVSISGIPLSSKDIIYSLLSSNIPKSYDYNPNNGVFIAKFDSEMSANNFIRDSQKNIRNISTSMKIEDENNQSLKEPLCKSERRSRCR